MSDLMRLHYAPDNASLCVRLALQELDLPYETVLVDRTTQAHKSDDFLALNPNGLIPVLETQDGPMFETAAIIIWLADREGALLPPTDAPARMYAVQWMMWLANTLHPTLRTLFYPAQYTDGDIGPTHRMAKQRLCQHLDVLAAAKSADWLEATDATAQGCYLAPMLRWARLYGGGPEWFDLGQWPRLLAFAQRAENRDAARTAARAEGLGPTPFSNPSPCSPPEGSAL
jgi:glutathione S-transferase